MSKLQEAFERGEFAITAEMAPPKGTDLSHLAECAKMVVGRVHAANVTDNQSAVVRATSLATCVMLKELGLEPVIQMTGRDRNRLAIESEMLSAGYFGIENLLALTGDHICVGDHKNAKPVFDLDSVSILATATMMNNGTDSAGLELKGKPNFFLGASVTPEYDPIEVQLLKMEKKIAAGARFFQTQAVYDIEHMRKFRELTKDMDCKVMAGIVPLKSPGMAKFMTANVPGIFVPEDQIERLKSVGKENYVAEGIKMAGEFIRQLKEEDLCDGVHIMAIGAEENVPLILDAAGL
ncbi:MAG: methylenetetrahydrofolate reductase [Intestinibacter sp.]